MPGADSSCDAASTAHGCTARDRGADVVRAEPAGEHEPAVRRRRAAASGRGPRPPTAGRRRARPARRRGAGRRRGRAPCPPRARRAGRGRRRCSSGSPTKTATLSTVSGTSSTRGRAARRALGEDEAAEVGAGLDRGVDVLLPRQPADLDERPREQLAQLRAGIGRAHQRRADEDRVCAGELGRGRLRPRVDRALGDDDAVARRLRDELELRGAVDRGRSRGRAR